MHTQIAKSIIWRFHNLSHAMSQFGKTIMFTLLVHATKLSNSYLQLRNENKEVMRRKLWRRWWRRSCVCPLYLCFIKVNESVPSSAYFFATATYLSSFSFMYLCSLSCTHVPFHALISLSCTYLSSFSFMYPVTAVLLRSSPLRVWVKTLYNNNRLIAVI